MGQKLNIPEKYQRWITKDLLDRNGEVKKNGDRWHANLYEIGWIEEIKDSEFDKWFNDQDFGENLFNSVELEHICRVEWQASQKNRDLLYCELVNINKYIVDSIVNDKNSRGLQDKLLKDICAELTKIKEQL